MEQKNVWETYSTKQLKELEALMKHTADFFPNAKRKGSAWTIL